MAVARRKVNLVAVLLAGLGSLVLSAWQDNHRPKMFVQLGAEDVDRFAGNLSNIDYFKLILRDGNFVLIGARNIVYNISITDFSEAQRLQWFSNEDVIKMCVVKGKDEENCQNYIRILTKNEPGNLLVCGTNSFKPLCREYGIGSGGYTLIREKPGQAVCPYDPLHNSTAVYVDGDLYTATVADFSGMDPIIYREPLQTEQFDSMSLNAPNFVSSMTQGDFIYFFFRETAVEYINCGKAVFSRVARVCKYDRGGPHRFRNRWTSFLKSRLNCSVQGDFPFYFNEIQSTTDLVEGTYGSVTTHLLYAVFTTPVNSIGGSAVCAFTLQEISDTFEGNFKEQSELNSNWLPVQSVKVPDPRPGQCANDSRTLPDLTLNFIKTHALMDESVPSFFRQPILVRTSFHYRFTQIAVDPQIKTPGGKSYDVLFIGTDNGKVLKTVNAESADSVQRVSPVVIEEIQVFPPNVSVRNLRIVRTDALPDGRLIVVSDSEVISLRLHRCDKVNSGCSECVALQDPYCAWDRLSGKCKSVGAAHWSDDKTFYQNIQQGIHTSCPSSVKSGHRPPNQLLATPTVAPDMSVIDVESTVKELMSQLSQGKSIDQSLLTEFEQKLCLKLNDVVKEAIQQCNATLREEFDVAMDNERQISRQQNIFLRGLPENSVSASSSVVRELELEEAIVEAINTKVRPLVPLDRSGIVHAKRVGKFEVPPGSQQPHPRPVIVTLAKHSVRTDILQHKNNLKGTGLVITEDLTLMRRNVLHAVMSKFPHQQVWSSEGIIKWTYSGQTYSATTINEFNAIAENILTSEFT